MKEYSKSGVRYRIRDYLDFLSTLSCAVCSQKFGVCGAHGSVAGKGEKGEDWKALPLCIYCHRMEHSGVETFWENVRRIYHKTRDELVEKYNKKYCKLRGITIDDLRGE